ncbi:MAG: hypothetical protein OEY63_07335 [Gemmatimonadota bacterium]|nr:hypothetical protein [Gemmatimonadota bacterium]
MHSLRLIKKSQNDWGLRKIDGADLAPSVIDTALLSRTTTCNPNNQQIVFGTNTLTYDLNGNLATVTEAGITTTYTWNARGSGLKEGGVRSYNRTVPSARTVRCPATLR